MEKVQLQRCQKITFFFNKIFAINQKIGIKLETYVTLLAFINKYSPQYVLQRLLVCFFLMMF